MKQAVSLVSLAIIFGLLLAGLIFRRKIGHKSFGSGELPDTSVRKTGDVAPKWMVPEAIDWRTVQAKIHEKLGHLFSSPPNPKPKFDLVFWMDTNGGLNFDVYQSLPDGTLLRLGDLFVEGWTADLSALDSEFNAVVETLAEKGEFETIARLDSKLRDILRTECLALERRHFGYASQTEISWRIQDEAGRTGPNGDSATQGGNSGTLEGPSSVR